MKEKEEEVDNPAAHHAILLKKIRDMFSSTDHLQEPKEIHKKDQKAKAKGRKAKGRKVKERKASRGESEKFLTIVTTEDVDNETNFWATSKNHLSFELTRRGQSLGFNLALLPPSRQRGVSINPHSERLLSKPDNALHRTGTVQFIVRPCPVGIIHARLYTRHKVDMLVVCDTHTLFHKQLCPFSLFPY